MYIDSTKSTRNINETDNALAIRPTPQRTFRTTFAKAVTSPGVDTDYFTLIKTGSGQAISQTGGNLVITTGTTVNAETCIRSTEYFNGALTARIKTILSQRIANNNFYVELVDVIGDSLAITISSAVAVTVTFPAGHGFTSANVGQSMYLGMYTGTGTFVPGRYAIASVSGDNITFTVAGFAAGSGTCSAFGWNYHQLVYTGVTATSANYDAQRNGYASGVTAATINTTASPGHIAMMNTENGVATFADMLVATSATLATTIRASRVENIPGNNKNLYLQIRTANGSTAPASTTTWTVGLATVEDYVPVQTSIVSSRFQSPSSTLPVSILATATVDTELPAAAAQADGQANPTTPPVAAFGSKFNGTTWDRDRGNLNTTTGDTGAKTASFGGATQTNYTARGAYITLIIGTVTGTTPTMSYQLQWSPDGGTTWLTMGAASANITAGSQNHSLLIYPTNLSQAAGTTPVTLTTGATQTVAINAPLPRTWRLNYTIGGTTPSFTITSVQVNYIL